MKINGGHSGDTGRLVRIEFGDLRVYPLAAVAKFPAPCVSSARSCRRQRKQETVRHRIDPRSKLPPDIRSRIDKRLGQFAETGHGEVKRLRRARWFAASRRRLACHLLRGR